MEKNIEKLIIKNVYLGSVTYNSSGMHLANKEMKLSKKTEIISDDLENVIAKVIYSLEVDSEKNTDMSVEIMINYKVTISNEVDSNELISEIVENIVKANFLEERAMQLIANTTGAIGKYPVIIQPTSVNTKTINQ